MWRIYSSIRKGEDIENVIKAFREYFNVEIEAYHVDGSLLQIIVGDYLVNMIRNTNGSKDCDGFDYSIDELDIYDIKDGFDTVESEVLHSFEYVDRGRFERVIKLLNTRNKNFFGIINDILDTLKEIGIENAHMYPDEGFPNEIKLGNGDILYVTRNTKNGDIRIERLMSDYSEYGQKLILHSKDWNEKNDYKEKILKFMGKFSSTSDTLKLIKNNIFYPSYVVKSLSNFLSKDCFNIRNKTIDYGSEAILACGDYTLVVRCKDKGYVYNPRDFEIESGDEILHSRCIEGVDVIYSISKGLHVSKDFIELTDKGLVELRNLLETSKHDICSVLGYLNYAYISNSKFGFEFGGLDSNSDIYYRHKDEKIQLRIDGDIVRVWINDKEIEELKFELDMEDDKMEEATSKIAKYIR